MPPIDANQDDDQDTRGAAEDAEEAALREELIQMLKGADTIGATSEEADGLLAPMDEPNKVKTTVSVEDGMILAEQARAGAVKPDAEADIDKQIDEKPADPASVAAQAAQTAAAPAADIALLLDGIDETKRTAIQARLQAGDDILQRFQGREAELAMHGNVTPAQAVERLLHLNEFAQAKPDEYLAWVASQMNGTAPQEVLNAAAKHLGFKLVPDIEDDPDDEFADPEKKALKAQLKALETAKAEFGPDAPQNVAALQVSRTLRAFREAKDATGQPLHPLADKFTSEMAGKVREWRAANGDKIPTAADMSRFYFDVAPALPGSQSQPAATPAQKIAAQPAPTVPEKTQPAAPTDRTAAASKLLDGSGPGADRRPAPSPLKGDALLRSQLAESMADAKGN